MASQLAATAHASVSSAFASGATLDVGFRKRQLGLLAQGLKANADEVVAAVGRDLGRPKVEALQAELLGVLGEIQLVASKLDEWVKDEQVETPALAQPATSWVQRVPLGPVLIIAPWNFPINLALYPLIGAIAAGCTAVLKPSEVTPNCSRVIANIVRSSLDPKAYVCVEGGVAETTELLKLKWGLVFYTGNGEVARVVAAAAAKNLTPVVLELGGKSPVYVAEDADIPTSAKRIMAAKIINAGQMCVSPDHVFVHHSVKDAFVKECLAALSAFLGPDPRSSPHFGRIVNTRHFDRVVSLLDPKAHGGKVLSSSAPGKPTSVREERFIAPALIVDPKLDSRIMLHEEIFGPILPIVGVASLDEAARVITARGETPLAAYCFTASDAVVRSFLSKVRSGGVTVNDCVSHVANSSLPFGGCAESGCGAYHGKFSFDAFTHQRGVMQRPFQPDKKLYPPFAPAVEKMLRSMV